jgi:Helicase conserved C-terminal domain
LAPVLKRRIVAEPDVAKHFKAPVCTTSVTTLDWDTPHLSYFLKVADEFSEKYRRMKSDAVQGKRNLNMVALLARISAVLKAGNQPSYGNDLFGSYAPLTSKERYLIERASKLAAEGRKILLYVDGPQMSERLAAELNQRGVHSVPFHGQQSIKARTRRMNAEFRYGPASVLVASYGTGQTGLNLYQANYVLLAVRGWNDKTERQAIARTLRPQQTEEVHAEFVHLAGSLDEYQAQVCQWKQVSEFEAIDLLEPEEALDDYKHLDRIINEFVEGIATLRGKKSHELREELRNAA